MQPQAGPPANRLLRDARRGHQGLLGGPRLHGSLLFVWPGHGPGWPGRGSRFPPGSFLVRVCPTLLRQILFKLTILLKCPSSACRLDSSPRRQKPSGERALSFLPPRTPSFLPLSSGWGGKGYFPGSSKAPFLLPPAGTSLYQKKPEGTQHVPQRRVSLWLRPDLSCKDISIFKTQRPVYVNKERIPVPIETGQKGKERRDGPRRGAAEAP